MKLKVKEEMQVRFIDGKRTLYKDGIEVNYDEYKFEYYDKYIKRNLENEEEKFKMYYKKKTEENLEENQLVKRYIAKKFYYDFIKKNEYTFNGESFFFDSQIKNYIFDTENNDYFINKKFFLNSLIKEVKKSYNLEDIEKKCKDKDNVPDKITYYILGYLPFKMRVYKDCIKYLVNLSLQTDVDFDEDKEKIEFNKLLFRARYEYITGIKFGKKQRGDDLISSVEFNIRNALKQEQSKERCKVKSDFANKYLNNEEKTKAEVSVIIEEVLKNYNVKKLQENIIEYIEKQKGKKIRFENIKRIISEHYTINVVNNPYFDFDNKTEEQLEKEYILKFVHGWIKGRYRKLKKYNAEVESSKTKDIIFIFSNMHTKVKYRFISNAEYNKRNNNKKNLYVGEKDLNSIDKEIIKCEETFRKKTTQAFVDFQLNLNKTENNINSYNEAFGSSTFNQFINFLENNDLLCDVSPTIYKDYEKEFSKDILFGVFRNRQYLVHFQNMNINNIYQENSDNFNNNIKPLKSYKESLPSNNLVLNEILNESVNKSFVNLIESKELYHLNKKGFKLFINNVILKEKEIIETNFKKHTLIPRFSKVGVDLLDDRTEENIIKNRIYYGLCNLIYDSSYVFMVEKRFKHISENALKNSEQDSYNKLPDLMLEVFRKQKDFDKYQNDFDKYQQAILSACKSKPELLEKLNKNFNKLIREDFKEYLNEVVKINIDDIFDEITIYDKTIGNQEVNEKNQFENERLKNKIDEYKNEIKNKNIEIDFKKKLDLITKYDYVIDMLITTLFCNNHSISLQIQNISKYIQFLQALSIKYGQVDFEKAFNGIVSKNIGLDTIKYKEYINVLKATQNILTVVLKDNSFNEDSIIFTNDYLPVLEQYQNDKDKAPKDYTLEEGFFFPINNMNGENETEIYFNKNRIIKNLSNGIYLNYILNIHNIFMQENNLTASDFVKCYEIFKGKACSELYSDKMVKKEFKLNGETNLDRLKKLFNEKSNETILEQLYNKKNKLYEDIKNQKSKTGKNKPNLEKNLKDVYLLLNLYDFVRKYKNYILLVEAEKLINFQREVLVTGFRTIEKDGYFQTLNSNKINFSETTLKLNESLVVIKEICCTNVSKIKEARDIVVHNNYLKYNEKNEQDNMSLYEASIIFKNFAFKYNIRDHKNYKNYMEHALNRHKILEKNNKFISRVHPKYNFKLTSNIETLYYSKFYYYNPRKK